MLKYFDFVHCMFVLISETMFFSIQSINVAVTKWMVYFTKIIFALLQKKTWMEPSVFKMKEDMPDNLEVAFI